MIFRFETGKMCLVAFDPIKKLEVFRVLKAFNREGFVGNQVILKYLSESSKFLNKINAVLLKLAL